MELKRIIGEKQELSNKNEILNQTLNEYKINLEEKSKIAERLTSKRINQLGEGETSLPININQVNDSIKNNKFENLLISSTEKINYISKEIKVIKKEEKVEEVKNQMIMIIIMKKWVEKMNLI